MNFRVSARVVSHLGAELISSDEVAIYELVKNGFDAGSRNVEVSICYRAALDIVHRIQKPMLAWAQKHSFDSKCPQEVLQHVIAEINNIPKTADIKFSVLTQSDIQLLMQQVINAKTIRVAIQFVGKLNSIDVTDFGTGMTPNDVQEYYLTIGTSHRLQTVERILSQGSTDDVPAGEKGIGRLSAMRLGNCLEMFTVTKDAQSAVYVGINWRDFLQLRDTDVQNVPVEYEEQARNTSTPGTLISISDLVSDWPRRKSEVLGSNQLAKFIDPFPITSTLNHTVGAPKTVILKWNGETIDTKELISKYLSAAQNSVLCRLSFTQDGLAVFDSEFFFGETDTRPKTEIRRRYTIADFSNFTNQQLKEVGPFEFLLYHFPRNRLKAIPHFAARSEVKEWLDRGSGGLMLFRDGIRVLPYASEGDDWLDLDAKAFRGRGFRVNRIQIVGCARISRLANPDLVDQTNREGLRDNAAYRTFRSLILRHIQENFVSALDEHLRQEKADFEQLGRSVTHEYDSLNECAEQLASAARSQEWGLVQNGVNRLRTVLHGVGELNDAVEKALSEREGNRLQILELAATGMAAEAIAHDLEGVVETAMSSLNNGVLGTDARTSAAVRHIRSVHKAILVQVKQISPGPAKARRRASAFNIYELINDVVSFYEEKTQRHDIHIDWSPTLGHMQVKAVPGHVRQIFDNLFRNAVFWLDETRKKFPQYGRCVITISVDDKARFVRFGDTGIGIASEDADWVFQAFNTRRNDGRGLGLYICKELAEFNKISMSIDRNDPNEFGRFSTFLICFDNP